MANDVYVVREDPFYIANVFAEIEGMKSSQEDNDQTARKLSAAK